MGAKPVRQRLKWMLTYAQVPLTDDLGLKGTSLHWRDVTSVSLALVNLLSLRVGQLDTLMSTDVRQHQVTAVLTGQPHPKCLTCI